MPDMRTLEGTVVVRVHDDSPCPLTGRVVGRIDEDRVDVAWADEQYSDDPCTSAEWIDELTPRGPRA